MNFTKAQKEIKRTEAKAIEVVRKNRDSQNRELVQRKREFGLFLAWKILPPVLLGQKPEILRKTGLSDEAIELTQIFTQVEFARKYKLNPETLTAWNHKIKDYNLLDEHNKRMEELTRNVDAAFYHKTILEADAARVALWHRLHGKLKHLQGDTEVPQTIVNQHFTQNIINLGKKYDEELDQKYREAIEAEPDEVSGS